MLNDFRWSNKATSSAEKILTSFETRIKTTDDASLMQDWRTLFMQRYHPPLMADAGLMRGVNLLAGMPEKTKFTEMVATTTALLAYKSGKQDWSLIGQLFTPADSLINLYCMGAAAATPTPGATDKQGRKIPDPRPDFVAKPFLMLADTYHETGASYDDNYPGPNHRQGAWSGRDMEEELGRLIRTTGTNVPPAYADLCLRGLQELALGRTALYALESVKEKPATQTSAGSNYFDGLACVRD